MQFQGTHSLRSCYLSGIIILSQYVSLAAFSPYLSFFFSFLLFFLKAYHSVFKGLSQRSSHIRHLIISPSIYIHIDDYKYGPHDTWSSKLCFFWAQITDSFVQVRDVLQPAPPLLFTTVLTFLEKGRSFVIMQIRFCLFIESLSMRYVILSVHHFRVC